MGHARGWMGLGANRIIAKRMGKERWKRERDLTVTKGQ